MSHVHTSLSEIVDLIEKARNLLAQAECLWPDILEQELGASNLPEVTVVEELLHMATHEEASTLAFAIQDIETLLARVAVKSKYRVFDSQQFQYIVSSGWSTRLANELHEQIPQISLPELSALIKDMCAEWNGLPKVMCSMAGRLDADGSPAL